MTTIATTFSAQNTFSAPQMVRANEFPTFEIQDIGTGNTITLQRLRSDFNIATPIADAVAADWIDLASYTTTVPPQLWYEPTGTYWRYGIKTGNYGSGSPKAVLSSK